MAVSRSTLHVRHPGPAKASTSSVEHLGRGRNDEQGPPDRPRDASCGPHSTSNRIDWDMLTTLRLQSFKNFRDATLGLGPLTLLVGTNASGKSNLRVRPALGQVADKARVKVARDHAKVALAELSSMRFLDLDPDALRRPSLPGQTVLGDKGENLSSVLQSICTKPDLKAALASWIAELTPMDATDFEFPADQQGRILVSLIEKGGGHISAYSASDGTLRFLAMIAALLGPESSRFYFFEELDNGIHPARLHLLLGLIERQAERGTVQMVATIHSPELLALLDPKSLEKASLVYGLPGSNEGRIVRILDIPGAADLIAKQDLAKLHSTGWLEDAVYFSADDNEPAP